MAPLADTHVLVWLATDDRRLTASMRAAIIDRSEAVAVSAVTAWEYADLWQRGRLLAAKPLDATLADFDLDVLALPPGVWRLAPSLPDLHRDPVDRLLVAHAIAEDCAIITADATIRRYPVRCIG